MKQTLAIALLCSVSAHAWALSETTASTQDASDRTVSYDPHNRVPLTLQAGGLAVITFDPMESIEQVVKVATAPFGYSCEAVNAEQKNACDAGYTNNLPIVGKEAGKADMIVLTKGAPPNDRERAYLFTVTVVAGEDVTRHLTFSYSPQYRSIPPSSPGNSAPVATGERPAPRPTWKQKQAAREAELLHARLMSDVSYTAPGQHLNRAYLAQGRATDIAPVSAFDNSVKTAFRYPGTMPQPTVFRVLDEHQGTPAACLPGGHAARGDLEASEQAVNSRMVNDLLTVDDTAAHWRLRSGEAVLDIWNCAYDPAHAMPVGDVERRIIR